MKRIIFSIFLFCIIMQGAVTAASFRTLTNKAGKSIQAELISKTDLTVTVKIRGKSKTYSIDISNLSEADQDFIEGWEPDENKNEEAADNTDEVESSSRLYPMTKSEVRQHIKDILARKAETKGSSKEQDAVNLLNVYRFLCGVKPTVKLNSKLNDCCIKAAKKCKENGALSHDIGDFTDKSNLSTMGDIVQSVSQYIEDSGSNNRERRGHRRWCLNPTMKTTGFGSAGSEYSAMWAMDGANEEPRENSWSYPGRGFFPKDYMHGTGWSFYTPDAVPDKEKISVSIVKLSKRPDRPIPFSKDPDGKEIGVKYIQTYHNAINFEPEKFTAGDRGIFCVTITGPGLRERYIVEFF